MTRPTLVPVLLVPVALAACEPSPYDDMMIDSATLVEDDTSTSLMLAIVGSYEQTGARLEVHETSGERWSMPAQLSGTLLGVGVDISTTIAADLALEINASERPLGEILGDYSGSHVVFAGGIGGEFLDLENAAGCTITVDAFTLGVGFDASAALLRLEVLGDPERVGGTEDSGGA